LSFYANFWTSVDVTTCIN